MAEKFDVPFLGKIPIDPEIRKGGDNGEPNIAVILIHHQVKPLNK